VDNGVAMPDFELDLPEKEEILKQASRYFSSTANDLLLMKQDTLPVWRAFAAFCKNLSEAPDDKRLRAIKAIIKDGQSLCSYIWTFEEKSKNTFENKMREEVSFIRNQNDRLLSQNDDLIGIAKQSQADQKETKAELIATRAELKENEKKSSKVNARYFFAGIAVSALLTFLPAQLNKNWIYPKRPTYFVTSFLPKALLSRKPGIERGKRFYFEGPVVSFGNGKKPKHPSYEKETGSSQKSADRFAPKVAL